VKCFLCGQGSTTSVCLHCGKEIHSTCAAYPETLLCIERCSRLECGEIQDADSEESANEGSQDELNSDYKADSANEEEDEDDDFDEEASVASSDEEEEEYASRKKKCTRKKFLEEVEENQETHEFDDDDYLTMTELAELPSDTMANLQDQEDAALALLSRGKV